MPKMDRDDPYIRLRNNRIVHFKKPRPEEIKIEDCAYHLARLNRFSNSIEPQYSVAEHSVLMAHFFLNMIESGSYINKEELAKYALVHDNGEYILGDIAQPIKMFLADYQVLEHNLDCFLLHHFGLYPEVPPIIKQIDRRFCSTEQRDLRKHVCDTYDDPPIEGITFFCWPWEEAMSQFLLTFQSLFPDYKDVE